MNSFRQSHAVVIGINGYGNGIPQLRTAVNDARRIAQVLETEFGYAVQLLTEDVTLAKLSALLGEHLPIEVQADDRLLVYFAGHGIALDGDDGPAGYLVPQDARSDDRQSFLPMTELNGWLSQLPCRHLLLVLDCCFAGAFRWASTRELGALPEVIHKERFDRYIRDPAWQVITSAAYDQKALDVLSGEAIGRRAPETDHVEHSPFAAAFLRALEGEADLYPRAAPGRAGGDGVITATELYLFLRECVEVGAEDDGHRQTPGLWPLKRHDKGEYIHLIPGHELNLPPAPELNEANNPYRGLQSYDEEHAPVFFGRSQFVKKLAERVASQSLTVVLGASGTGKSSVVKAGLLSYLRGKEPDSWRILPPVRPGKSPLASLASLSLPGQDSDDLATRLAEYWTDPEALATRVGAWSAHEPAGRLLLVVDQFEELITLCWDPGEREQFLRLLDRALAAHPDRLRVVLTLRSDFEPQFAHTPLEDRWMSSRIVVPAMTLDEYREVIEGPASVRVLYFQGRTSSQEFINRLIGDVANTPGALPLLSFTMSELYRRYLERRGDDRSLREDDYVALGGVGGSLRNRANEVYDGLPDDAVRETMRRVMLRMISVEAGELARRRVPDSDLVYREPSENERVAKVLSRLTEARLVVEGKETDDQPYIEPAHDELIRGWDRLLDWARKGQEGLLLRRILTPAADDWKRGTGGLWHANPRLALVRRVLQATDCWLNQTESDFVQRSVLKRRTILGSTVAAVAVAFLVLSVITWLALENEHKAKEQTRISNAQRLVALSEQAFPKMPQQCLILAVEAIRATRDHGEPVVPAAVQALEDALTSVGGHALTGHNGGITALAFAPDGRLVTGAGDGTARVWDLNDPVAPPRALRGYDGAITALAFAPDGRLVTGSKDKTARVWDLKDTAAPPRVLRGHEGAINALAFAPDGRLVTGSADQTARVWDLKDTAAPPRVLRGHQGAINALAFAPDGRLVTGSADQTARVWDLRDPAAPPRVLRGHEGGILALALAPDGRLVTGSEDKTARVWDLTNPAAPPRVLRSHEGAINALAFAPDGRLVTGGGGGDGTARVWNLMDPAAPPRVLHGHEGGIRALAFAPDGRLVTGGGGGDGTARVWNLMDPAGEPRVLRGHQGAINALAIAPDGRLVTGGGDGTARVWDLKDPAAQPRVLRGHQGAIHHLAIAPDGRLVTGGGDGTAWVWDLTDPAAPPRVLRGHEGGILALALAPDGRLVTGGGDGTARVWDLRDPAAPPRVLRGHEGAINALAFAPDGRLVTGSKDKTARVWDLKNPAAPPRVLRGHQGAINALAIAPDGWLVMGSGDGTARVWNLRDPAAPPRALRGLKVQTTALALAPGGQLVTCSFDGSAEVWDLRDPAAPPRVLRGHEYLGAINALAFAPDGRLVTGSADQTARVWDLRDPAAPPRVLRGHEGAINALAIAPDGRLVTGGGDGTARVWSLDLDKLIQMAGGVAPRNLTYSEWRQFFGQQPYRRTFPALPDGAGVSEMQQIFGHYRRTFPVLPDGADVAEAR